MTAYADITSCYNAQPITGPIPKEYTNIVKWSNQVSGDPAICGYHPVHSGAWATDTYRLYVDCIERDVPEKVRKCITTNSDEAIWPVTDSFLRWLKVIKKADKRPGGIQYSAGVIPAEDRWLYQRGDTVFDDLPAAAFLQAPPRTNTSIGFNAEFLADAIEYLLGKKKGTIRVSTPAEPYAPWTFRANGRTAVIMPIRKD